ncbi:MAG: TatD family hydrolase [Methylotenera sp.]|nr:TatD family hydrolase [Methylotenera sp.]
MQLPGLIDTHCHLDAAEFTSDRQQVIAQAMAAGVTNIVIPAVARENFASVTELCRQYKNCACALGIHPMYVDAASLADLDILQDALQQNAVVAVGEIGLDYFANNSDDPQAHRQRQEAFFSAQLKLAKQFDLPVILHVRHAVDEVLKHLRRHGVRGGIAHAFNGSMQQAEQFIAMGFKLGFGGAMTYQRATKLRDLAKRLPLESLVLETDAPDMPPSWLAAGQKNSPKELPKIAQVLADLRQVKLSQVIDITSANARQVLPKLA